MMTKPMNKHYNFTAIVAGTDKLGECGAVGLIHVILSSGYTLLLPCIFFRVQLEKPA